jgi:hypothetical protein
MLNQVGVHRAWIVGLPVLCASASLASAQVLVTTYRARSVYRSAVKAISAQVDCSDVEDLEGSGLPPGSSALINDPLAPGVPNGPYTSGLRVPGLQLQSRTAGGTPRGVGGLTAVSRLVSGQVRRDVISTVAEDSFDVVFTTPGVRAAELLVIASTPGAAQVTVSVFDRAGNPLLAAPELVSATRDGVFLGFIGPRGVNIGRINLLVAGNPLQEGADDIAFCTDRDRFEIRWSTIDSGGIGRDPSATAAVPAGVLSLSGAFGQWDARSTSTSVSGFTLTSGFWIGAAAPVCPGRGPGACSPADLDENGVLDFNDFLVLLNLFNNNDLCVDFDGSGSVDFNDLLAYLNLFTTPC